MMLCKETLLIISNRILALQAKEHGTYSVFHTMSYIYDKTCAMCVLHQVLTVRRWEVLG